MQDKKIISKIETIAKLNNDISVVAKYTLSNLHIIHKLNEEEFIAHSFINPTIFNKFLMTIEIADYHNFAKQISLYLIDYRLSQHLPQTPSKKMLQNFYSQLLNSLDVTYGKLNEQDEVLNQIIEQFKNANQIYIFTQRNSLKIIEEFTDKLIFAGFNIKIISDFFAFDQIITKFNHRTLVLFVFDDYQNKPLVEIAQKIQESIKESQIRTLIISKQSFHELHKLNGLKLIVEYWNFPRHSTLNVRAFSLLFILNLIFAKISETIISNYHQIIEDFTKR